MFYNLKTTITVFAVCINLWSVGQTQLYLEDFSGQDGKGFDGLVTDTSGVNWTIDTNLHSNFSTDPTKKYFRVQYRGGSEVMSARNLDGEGFWLGPIVDANPGGSNFERYVLSVDVLHNSGKLELQDTLQFEYSVNNSGTWTTFSSNGLLVDDIPNSGATVQSVITGGPVSTIQVRTRSYLTNGTGEIYYWDNVSITGYEAGEAESVSAISGTPCSSGQLDLAWELPVSYNNTTDEVLVFVKQGSAVSIGAPSNASSTYTANSSFGLGTSYENDANAYCVYKGDGSNVSITGLPTGFTYHVAIFNTYSSPVGYSAETTSSFAISSVTDDVTNLSVALSGIQIEPTWTAPTSCYSGFLVAINTSSITGVPSGSYTVNSNSLTDGSNPTLSDGSVLVYADIATSAQITDLTSSTDYYVKVFAFNGTNYATGVEVLINTGSNPEPGDFIISEVVDGTNNSTSYLELYNFTSNVIDLSTCKLVRLSSSLVANRIIDLDTEGTGDRQIPANGFIVITRNSDQTTFESTLGESVDPSANFLNSGNRGTFNSESNGWQVKCGGTNGTDDGVLIDDLGGATKGKKRAYQYPRGNWVRTGTTTPRSLGSFDESDDSSIEADMAYNGEWRGGTPGAGTGGQKAVVSDGNAPITGDASLDSIEVRNGASITISNNATLTIGKDIVNNGTVTVESGSSLLQTQSADNNTGSGTYEIQRNTGALVDDTRYQFWSSPVTNATMGGVFTGSNATDFYFFDEGSTNNWASQASGDVMIPGRGYITTGSIGISGSSETRSFSGQVNNGIISLSTSNVSAGEHLLVGNPYPSAISSSLFVNDNAGIDGTLWFWNHSTPENGGDNSDADYATWTGVGATGGNSNDMPDDYIQSGQGFFVKSSSSNPTIVFQNDQRLAGNNTQFFKSASGEKHRIWLAIRNSQNDYNQILVGFMNGATDGMDAGLDGEKFKAHPRISFYSYIEDLPFSIQGMSKLVENESKVIPLGIDAWISGTYSISLDSLDNWPDFYHAFLIDTELDSTVSLKDHRVYTFNVDSATTLSERFLLVVNHEENQTTNVAEVFEKDVYQVFQTADELVIRVIQGQDEISQIVVVDVAGKVVAIRSNLTKEVRIFTSEWQEGLYIISGKTTKGNVIQKKVMKF